jgi:hypothetical protein
MTPQRRTILAALSSLALAGMTGCGTSESTGKAGAPAKSASETRGFFDMEALEEGIKSNPKINERLAELSSEGSTKITVDNVTCIQTGKLSAECNATYSNKESSSVEVSIAEDGQTYITH